MSPDLQGGGGERGGGRVRRLTNAGEGFNNLPFFDKNTNMRIPKWKI